MVRLRQPPGESDPRAVLRKLHGLQTELAELAFALDRRGRAEAADVAIALSGRLGELCDELGEGAPVASDRQSEPSRRP